MLAVVMGIEKFERTSSYGKPKWVTKPSEI